MAESSSGEKTEQPTPRKLQEARKRGVVTKSTDVVGSLVLMSLLIAMPAVLPRVGTEMLSAFQNALSEVPQELDSGSLTRMMTLFVRPGLMFLGVIVAAAMTVGLAANVAQVGFKLSPEALQFKFDKLNPVEGAKRLFSRRAIFEGLKAFVKGALFAWLAWSAAKEQWLDFTQYVWVSPAVAAAKTGSLVIAIGMRVGVAWLILAAIDYAFQRKQTMKQLMMTKDELKREMKEQEGSPEIKMARHQRMRKLSRGRVAQAVKTADVIITNPTHFAVALKYDRSAMHAPMVVAKGQDYLALKIRELANDAGVPIVPNPPLARSLYKKCEVGDFIPRDMFGAVAEVLAYVMKATKSARR